MSLKKLLGIISVVIIVVFSMMLTTSYAWYSFENASTVFEGMTSNDDVIISYQHGEYINTSIAVPITSNQVDMYSDKNNFSIKVKDNTIDNEYLVTISLVDISMDAALQNANFKVDFYHQSTKVGSYAGNGLGVSGATTKTLGTITLDNNIINNFELRVYILDNGTNQSTMMNKTFQAKIKIDVVSRLKTSFDEWKNPDIYISSVTIDGEESDYIPTSGYYSMSSSCTKAGNNTLTWDPLSKTITYPSRSYVNDDCSLAFTTSTDYPLLSEMPVGSYVKYTGTNGCDGKHCEGYNANYVSDTDMGYCSGSKFYVNGWRIGYIENGSAVLVSAGAPECVATYISSKSDSTSVQTLSTNYYYGTGYNFDDNTGVYSLTGVTSTAMSWITSYQDIIDNTPYTCKSTSSTGTCTTMYEIVSFSSSTQGISYSHINCDNTAGSTVHIASLSSKVLKYCNSKYLKGGLCDNSTVWVMNAGDFEKITGNSLNYNSCYESAVENRFSCGYTNDLIDNGGTYWLDIPSSSSSNFTFIWDGWARYVSSKLSNNLYGIRPVLYLDSSIYVKGGSGTYDDPYVIGI